MSTIDQKLLDDLYGANNPEGSDEMIKEAQAELIEAVADEAGIDLNTLDDSELDKFAEYVLSPDGQQQHLDPNLAIADAMGRQMAHSYADEQVKIASQLERGDNMSNYTLEKAAARWDLIKEADSKEPGFFERSLGEHYEGAKRKAKSWSGYDDFGKGRAFGKDLATALETGSPSARASAAKKYDEFLKNLNPSQLADHKDSVRKYKKAIRTADKANAAKLMNEFGSHGEHMRLQGLKSARTGSYLRAGAKGAGTLAVLGGLGYGGKKLMDKKSSYDPAVAWIEDLEGYEFAKLAEFRAAEILAANGVDPQTFEQIHPEHIKVANFPAPEEASSYSGASAIETYNEMLDEAALDILEDMGLV